ncbi:MAG: diacylglycerol kinase family lipid kinase [Bacteroidota bacterium]|nr:diacylglycerol kinase family lipid kinase [Bacteroidota bacterium]
MEDQKKYKYYLFIINPISGDIDKENLAATIEEFAIQNNLEAKIHYTSGQNDDEEIKKAISYINPEVVVAVGGDGTVNMVAKHIAGTDKILGIMPMGSGNGLSKDLEIPQNNPERALSILANPKVIEMDTLNANNHFFAHLADIGFNARIVRLFSKDKNRGFLTYLKYTLKEFFKYETSRYSVESDYGSFSGNAFMITIANSNQFGTNLTINPNGKYDDGKFEVIIIKRFPRIESFRLFFQLLLKRIDFSPYCIILKCKEAVIKCSQNKTIQYDGEIGGEYKEINVKIHPNNLKVIVP